MPAATAAQAPVPQARVSPVPRSYTRRRTWPRLMTCMKPAFTRCGKRTCRSISGPQTSHGGGVHVIHQLHGMRVAHGYHRYQNSSWLRWYIKR